MGSDDHSLIGAFHDALLDPGQWSDTLREFADRFGSSHAILAINGRSSRPPDVVWAGVERAFQDLYANSFVNGSNPVLLAPTRELKHEPFTDRMAMPDGSFRRSAFFQDWCRGRGVLLNLPAAEDHHADIVIVPIAPDHGWAEGSETCVAVFVTAGNGGVDVDPALLPAVAIVAHRPRRQRRSASVPGYAVRDQGARRAVSIARTHLP